MDLHRHAATIALLVVAAPFVLAPGKHAAPAPRAPVIDNSEHARTIEAMRPPKRARPVIAILALNAATEVMDLLVPFACCRFQRRFIAHGLMVSGCFRSRSAGAEKMAR